MQKYYSKLVDTLLENGRQKLVLQVWDSEEWCAKSRDKEQIIADIESVEMSQLHVFDGEEQVGWFRIIPSLNYAEQIYNYVANDFCELIMMEL